MKALNRAIWRTVSQLARFGGDEYHPLMKHALVQHLSFLLAMERKQLELSGMKEATLAGDGTGQALPGVLAHGVGVLVHGGGVRACHGTAHVVGGMGGPGAGNSGTMISGTNGRGAGAGTGSTIAFSTPQGKNGSLLDSFIANGMMEQDAFREHHVPPVQWTPETVALFNGMEPEQLQPRDSALEKACEAATNAAREAVRYMNQRDELMDVLVQVQSHFETGKIRHGLDIRQVVSCALEHFRRDGVSPKNTMLTTRHFVEHATKLHAKPLPAETEAQLPPKPVRTYQTGVRGLGDPGLQWTPVAASEQPVPPAPDVINMANPANWLPGDKLLRKYVHGNFPHFTSGREYTVTSNGPDVLTIMGNDGVEVTYPHKPFCEPASNFFTWLRHGEAQQ